MKRRRYFVRGLAIIVLYLAFTQLGLLFALAPVGISPVWPPAGLALTLVLLLGNSYLPVVALAALIGNLVFLNPVLSVSSALATTLEIFFTVSFIRKFSGSRDLDSPKAVIFFLAGATLGSLLGALLGVFAFCALGYATWPVYLKFVQTWWLGDLFGILIVTPLLLSWRHRPNLYATGSWLEGLVLTCVLATVGTFVFWGWGLPFEQYPIEHLCIPILLWAAFRFGQKGASASIVLLSVIAIWGTSQGLGPFAFGTALASLHLLQLFIGTSAITLLLIAASRVQHRRAAMALKYSEALYQSLIENLPLSIFRKDINGAYIFVNRRFCEVFGYSRSKVIGKTAFELFEKDLAEKYSADDQFVIRTQKEYDTVEEIRSQGKEIFVHTVKTPVHNSEGAVVGVMGALWDVTQREETQRALKRAMQMADTANIAKSEFLANMSHEIRTPLAAILGFVERMEVASQSALERQRDIQHIRRSVNHLTELIDDVLDLSKFEAGKLVIDRTRFDLVSELRHTYQMLKTQAKAKNLFLSIHLENSIPSSVTTDPRRFRQILINIVGNAIKFTKKGGIRISVFYSPPSITGESVLRVQVQDTGCGIPKESQQYLFRAFVQADASTTRKYGGTGLGLSLSKRLAQSLGGDIRLVESELGKGSLFEIEINVDVEPGTQMLDQVDLSRGEKQTAPIPIEAGEALANMRVLLAEDGEDNRELVSYFLSNSGAKVDVAVNGAIAVAMANKNPYDVILMDIQMPVVDGYTAIRRLRKTGYKKPILALTAHAMLEEKKKCFDAGCDAYITKPIQRAALIHAVKKFSQKQSVQLPM